MSERLTPEREAEIRARDKARTYRDRFVLLAELDATREELRIAYVALDAANAQYARLAAAVNENDSPCLPTCDSVAHDENCPHVSNAVTLERQQSRIAELEAIRFDLEEDLGLAKYENELDATIIRNLESNLETTRKRIAALEAELAEAKIQIVSLKTSLVTEQCGWHEQVTNLEADNARLTQALGEARTRIESLRQRVHPLDPDFIR